MLNLIPASDRVFAVTNINAFTSDQSRLVVPGAGRAGRVASSRVDQQFHWRDFDTAPNHAQQSQLPPQGARPCAPEGVAPVQLPECGARPDVRRPVAGNGAAGLQLGVAPSRAVAADRTQHWIAVAQRTLSAGRWHEPAQHAADTTLRLYASAGGQLPGRYAVPAVASVRLHLHAAAGISAAGLHAERLEQLQVRANCPLRRPLELLTARVQCAGRRTDPDADTVGCTARGAQDVLQSGSKGASPGPLVSCCSGSGHDSGRATGIAAAGLQCQRLELLVEWQRVERNVANQLAAVGGLLWSQRAWWSYLRRGHVSSAGDRRLTLVREHRQRRRQQFALHFRGLHWERFPCRWSIAALAVCAALADRTAGVAAAGSPGTGHGRTTGACCQGCYRNTALCWTHGLLRGHGTGLYAGRLSARLRLLLPGHWDDRWRPRRHGSHAAHRLVHAQHASAAHQAHCGHL